jgi:hypothetical protein
MIIKALNTKAPGTKTSISELFQYVGVGWFGLLSHLKIFLKKKEKEEEVPAALNQVLQTPTLTDGRYPKVKL